jgi:hypothetical protein
LDRVEATTETHAKAIAELVLLVKGNWSAAGSAAAAILHEQRQRDAERAELEDRIRAEVDTDREGEIARRLAESSL